MVGQPILVTVTVVGPIKYVIALKVCAAALKSLPSIQRHHRYGERGNRLQTVH